MDLKLMITSILTCFGLIVGGCSTQHTGYNNEDMPEDPFQRRVESEIKEAFYRQPPSCVTVLPVEDSGGRKFIDPLIEKAIARHARDRFDRVIGHGEREYLVKRLGFDLINPIDRKRYADKSKCANFLEFVPWRGQSAYLVVWSRRAVGIEARLTSASRRTILWRARHEAKRSAGGLAVSPLSAFIKVVETTAQQSDNDIRESLADDVARRLMKSLPDLRSTEMAIPGSSSANGLLIQRNNGGRL